MAYNERRKNRQSISPCIDEGIDTGPIIDNELSLFPNKNSIRF